MASYVESLGLKSQYSFQFTLSPRGNFAKAFLYWEGAWAHHGDDDDDRLIYTIKE